MTVPVAVNTTTVPSNTTVGQTYPATTLEATGGTAPYSWAVSSGTLPPGLSLSPSGVLSGTTASAGTFDFTLQATDDTYPGATATQSYSVTVDPQPPGAYSPLTPVRICDTRAGNPSDLSGDAAQCNGVANAGETLSAGGTKTISVAGEFGVPADATAVVLNVTVVNPQTQGHLTVFPAGSSPPLASNINYGAGQTVPNLVEVGTGTNGDVSFNTLSQTDLAVDLEGYVAASAAGGSGAGLYTPLASPVRICDTRPGNPSGLSAPDNQCNGVDKAGETLGAGGTLGVQVGGDNGIPADASAVVLNVTSVNAQDPGHLTVYPQGAPLPVASNVNYQSGTNTANRVIVPLSASGGISVTSSAASDVLVDVSGYYSALDGSGTEFTSEGAPVRICDTRAGNPSDLSGAEDQCLGKTLGAGSTLTINVAGLAGVPSSGAKAVVVNLTGVGPSAQTHLTVFPTLPIPTTSDLNLVPGVTRANLVVATLSSTGTISIYNNSGSTDVLVDLLGWYS
ncbi:MAG: Ig domain-containing protein [Acidimicrobiales bacterium]